MILKRLLGIDIYASHYYKCFAYVNSTLPTIYDVDAFIIPILL